MHSIVGVAKIKGKEKDKAVGGKNAYCLPKEQH